MSATRRSRPLATRCRGPFLCRRSPHVRTSARLHACRQRRTRHAPDARAPAPAASARRPHAGVERVRRRMKRGANTVRAPLHARLPPTMPQMLPSVCPLSPVAPVALVWWAQARDRLLPAEAPGPIHVDAPRAGADGGQSAQHVVRAGLAGAAPASAPTVLASSYARHWPGAQE